MFAQRRRRINHVGLKELLGETNSRGRYLGVELGHLELPPERGLPVGYHGDRDGGQNALTAKTAFIPSVAGDPFDNGLGHAWTEVAWSAASSHGMVRRLNGPGFSLHL